VILIIVAVIGVLLGAGVVTAVGLSGRRGRAAADAVGEG